MYFIMFIWFFNSFLLAEDLFNERIDGKITRTTSTTSGKIASQKEKSIANKIKPMNPIKSNEIGNKYWVLLFLPYNFPFHFAVYSIKRDFSSETKDETDQSKPKMTQISPKKVDGIGPITQEGMPLSLRSVSMKFSTKVPQIQISLTKFQEVRNNNHGTWYKKVYNTIHKPITDDGNFTLTFPLNEKNFIFIYVFSSLFYPHKIWPFFVFYFCFSFLISVNFTRFFITTKKIKKLFFRLCDSKIQNTTRYIKY